jgi:hypothetical protein
LAIQLPLDVRLVVHPSRLEAIAIGLFGSSGDSGAAAVVEQPSGTVTLVLTNIEGSTRLLHHLGNDAFRQELSAQRRVLRDAFSPAPPAGLRRSSVVVK